MMQWEKNYPLPQWGEGERAPKYSQVSPISAPLVVIAGLIDPFFLSSSIEDVNVGHHFTAFKCYTR